MDVSDGLHTCRLDAVRSLRDLVQCEKGCSCVELITLVHIFVVRQIDFFQLLARVVLGQHHLAHALVLQKSNFFHHKASLDRSLIYDHTYDSHIAQWSSVAKCHLTNLFVAPQHICPLKQDPHNISMPIHTCRDQGIPSLPLTGKDVRAHRDREKPGQCTGTHIS